MALNPYTLYHLYDKGILDYVPTDLLTPTQMGAMTSMSNPYLDMAMQGNLYQTQGNYSDSFQSSVNGLQQSYGQNYQSYSNIGNPVQIGSNSNVGGMNTFNGYGVGTQSSSSFGNMFGFGNGIGSQSNVGGMNIFNGYGVGTQSQTGGMNIFGGYADTQNRLSSGFNKALTVVNNTPRVILGILAGVIGLAAIKRGFRVKKKVVKPKTSFWSNFNPMNLFKKSKKI